VTWLLLPFAYALGTFPSAVIVARSKGIDITAVGSGNPGASNVARTLGSRWGIVVFVLDGLKGAIPAGVGVALGDRPLAYGLVCAAVIGHMFPVTRPGKGGKGVATMGGAVVVLHPIVFGVLLVVWYVVRRATRIASLASIAIAIGLPIGVALGSRSAWEVAATVALSALVMARHRSNIERLIRGRELSSSRS
jgi:glycerol-3-phosphate acyltransferase PlsY